jgi:hypothetical protein
MQHTVIDVKQIAQEFYLKEKIDELLSSGVSNEYSLEEKPIMTYDFETKRYRQALHINNKPMWKRAFQGTITVAANTKINTTLLSNSNIDELLNSGGWWDIYEGHKYPINSSSEYLTTGKYEARLYQQPNGADLGLATYSYGNRTNTPYFVWIEYTKLN